MSEKVAGKDVLPNVLRLGLSDAFKNKDIIPPHSMSAYGDSFHPKTVSPADVVAHINAGKAITMSAFQTSHRESDNFESSQLLGLDLDDDISIADCLQDDFIRQYAYFLYATPSDTPQKRKTRVLFMLNTPVQDVDKWQRYQRALLHKFTTLAPDPACKDPARLFFGSTKGDYKVFDQVLPCAIMDAVVAAASTEIIEQEKRTKEDNARIRKANQERIKDDKKQLRYYRYASTALDNMVSELSSMGEGGRNNTLFKFAAAMGNMVAARMIDYSEVHSALYGAAQASGLERHEIEGTLNGGLMKGQGTPTDLTRLDQDWESKRRQFTKKRRDEQQREQASKRKLALQDAIDKLKRDDFSEQAYQLRRDAFEAGVYASWWNKRDIPLSHLSCIMNLADTKSLLPVVIGKMHTAFRAGQLDWSDFTIEDVCNITKKDRRVVVSCLETLQKWGFIRFLGTYLYIYTNTTPAENVQKGGRPSRHYTIHTDTMTLQLALERMITIHLQERHHKTSKAQHSRKSLEDIGIESQADYQAAMARNEAIAKDFLSRSDNAAFEKDMNGDGINWRGWKLALGSSFAFILNWDSIETNKQLRSAILRLWVQKVRQENTREELCRLLGCSDGSLQDAMEAADIGTKKQWGSKDVAVDFDDLRPVIRGISRDERAHVYDVRVQYTGYETSQDRKGKKQHWHKVGTVEEACKLFARGKEKVSRVFLRYCKPSVQFDNLFVRLWMQYFAQILNAFLVWIETTTNLILSAIGVDIPDMPEPEQVIADIPPDEPQAEPEQPKESDDNPVRDVVVQERDYTKYSQEFLFEQLRCEVFMFTPHTLGNDYSVLDKDHKTIYRGQNMADIVRYLNRHAGHIPKRTSAEFFEIEEKNLNKEIAEIYQERREKDLEGAKVIYLQDEYDKRQAAERRQDRVGRETPKVIQIAAFQQKTQPYVNRFAWYRESRGG